MLMARDFGIKKGVRTVDFITKDMLPEDQNQFKSWIGDKTKYHDRKKLNLLTNFYLKELNDAVRNQRH